MKQCEENRASGETELMPRLLSSHFSGKICSKDAIEALQTLQSDSKYAEPLGGNGMWNRM